MAIETIDKISKCSNVSVILATDSQLPIQAGDSTAPAQESTDSVVSQTPEPVIGHTRRLSDVNLGISRNKGMILSRYLSASRGSCHDVCKYGTKGTFEIESETRNLVFKGNAKTQEGQIKEKNVTSGETSGKLVANLMRSNSKSRRLDVLLASQRKVSSSTNKEIVLSNQLSARPKRSCDVKQKLKPALSKSFSLHTQGSSGRIEDSKLQGNNGLGASEAVRSKEMKTSLKGNRRVLAGTTVLSSPRLAIKKNLKQPKLTNLDGQDGERKAENEEASAEEVPEKILYVIEPENETKNSQCKMNSVHCLKDKHTASSKLKFQTGKVVVLQPEASTARKLKFKQRVLRKITNAKDDTKTSKLKNAELGGESEAIDSARETLKEKVTLRHQRVQQKELRSLLNNVIEETASNLAKTRKSKVKVLVSAFESVISIKDSKGSS